MGRKMGSINNNVNFQYGLGNYARAAEVWFLVGIGLAVQEGFGSGARFPPCAPVGLAKKHK
jgi:hypothetical protein